MYTIAFCVIYVIYIVNMKYKSNAILQKNAKY